MNAGDEGREARGTRWRGIVRLASFHQPWAQAPDREHLGSHPVVMSWNLLSVHQPSLQCS